ncbi:MAG TPA: VOC family protein [Thermoleophilaceae bacterium]|nr:VOC family protein [Thermoleophilaceae bacterium]
MQSIFPVLKYDDARAAIDFLERAFGFERHAVHEGENGGVAHAELRLGDEYVMLGSTGEGDDRFNQGAGRYSLYVAVEDPDAHLARASEAGATIERELSDTDYGSREYTARDPEGNLWSFGTYRPEG